jgi:hypothetical protein
MIGAQVVATSGTNVLPVFEGELSPHAWSDNEFINASCAAIPVHMRQEAIAALLSIVGRTH